MARVVRILHVRYLDKNGDRYIGGVESYIRGLCEVSIGIGYSVIVYQYAETNFVKEMDGYRVVGVYGKRTPRTLIDYIEEKDSPDYENDLLIFATDFSIVNNKYRHSVAIQHGIAWDITKDNKVSDLNNILTIFKGVLRSIRKYQRYKWCENIVCVDYNFVNWYRTQVAHIDANIFVVPNFATTKEVENKLKKDNTVSIVFARRLEDYRGTKLFASSIIEVLKVHPEIKVSIAGDGPDESWLHQHLGMYDCVTFTKFKTEESIQFHSGFDIAVVPTKGSEGTSLSLLEAMSAGCAVIATNVGGMTNIILDEYNGLMISPDVNELKAAIVRLIEDKELRNFLYQKAQETVQKSFSYDKWKSSWIKVIQSIEKE
jgi:glycosyltransferase involved in cell wall biosynthesis